MDAEHKWVAGSPGLGLNGQPFVSVASLKPLQHNINLICIVIEKGPIRTTHSSNLVCLTKVADVSGCVTVSLWDEHATHVRPGDILHFAECYTQLYNQKLVLYKGKQGLVKRTGEVCLKFSEKPDISSWTWEPDPNAKGNHKAFIPRATNTHAQTSQYPHE